MWIDSHCHLTHARLREKIGTDAAISNARNTGISGMLSICCRMSEDTDDLLGLARTHDDIWCSVGTHPHDAGVEAEQAYSEDDIVRLALSDPNIIGIGESGLDYYYDNSPRQAQQDSFRKHIRACIRTNMPLIIHARDADEDIARIMREEGAGEKPLKGVMHCFSSSPELGRAALDMGFLISFSGIVTFKKSTELQDFARTVPLDKILVETDAPFLAPEPKRGSLNEPANVIHTGRYLASILNMHEEDIASICKENFFTLFDRAGGPA